MNRILSALKPYIAKLLFIPPVAVGVFLLAMAVRNRAQPEKIELAEQSRSLRVINVEQMNFVPRASGYGTARPSKVWQAIAEVKGKVVGLNPNLQTGSFVKQGTVLVQIDDTDTKIAITKLNAEKAKAKSSIAELTANQKNFDDSIKLERQALAVAEQELRRIQNLVQQNAVSRAEFDSQQRAVISQRQKVQSIASSINLLPSQLNAAKANLAVAEASLMERNRDLERVILKAPFDCRIGPVQLELNQFVASGSTLFEAQSTSQIEIEAQVAIRNLRPLFNEELRKQDMAQGKTDINQKAMKRYFDVEAVARYSAGNQRIERKATFERIREELDSQTRAIGVIVVIDKPFVEISDGPPPVSGTHCEVELRSKAKPNQIVIPRSSIHEDHVYVLDDQFRLRRKKVEVQTLQSELAVITNGLNTGEILVVSDPTPAVEGMLVKPILDAALLENLKSQANGKEPLR